MRAVGGISLVLLSALISSACAGRGSSTTARHSQERQCSKKAILVAQLSDSVPNVRVRDLATNIDRSQAIRVAYRFRSDALAYRRARPGDDAPAHAWVATIVRNIDDGKTLSDALAQDGMYSISLSALSCDRNAGS